MLYNDAARLTRAWHTNGAPFSCAIDGLHRNVAWRGSCSWRINAKALTGARASARATTALRLCMSFIAYRCSAASRDKPLAWAPSTTNVALHACRTRGLFKHRRQTSNWNASRRTSVAASLVNSVGDSNVYLRYLPTHHRINARVCNVLRHLSINKHKRHVTVNTHAHKAYGGASFFVTCCATAQRLSFALSRKRSWWRLALM